MASYQQGGQETVELGGLRFVVMHRTLGDDGGASIEVFGDVGDRSVQVLRFDCFKKGPHYHYAPAGDNSQRTLDQAEVGDGLDWAMEQIRSHIPEMLKTAGYDELAGSVDPQALAAGWTRVKDAVAATAPKS